MGLAAAASRNVFRIVALGTGGFAMEALSRRKGRPAKVGHFHEEVGPDHFLRIIFKPTFGRLVIPKAFVKWFGEIPSNIIVTTNTRCNWRMTTRREGNDAFIDQGWTAFAVAHQLKVGQFLTFRKVSSFEYSVVIFDHTCTEVFQLGTLPWDLVEVLASAGVSLSTCPGCPNGKAMVSRFRLLWFDEFFSPPHHRCRLHRRGHRHLAAAAAPATAAGHLGSARLGHRGHGSRRAPTLSPAEMSSAIRDLTLAVSNLRTFLQAPATAPSPCRPPAPPPPSTVAPGGSRSRRSGSRRRDPRCRRGSTRRPTRRRRHSRRCCSRPPPPSGGSKGILTHTPGAPWCRSTLLPPRWVATMGRHEGAYTASPHVQQPPRFTKLEFATYDGTVDPLNWLNHCDQIFRGRRTMASDCTWIASYHLRGAPQTWYYALEQDEGRMPSWERFRDLCLLRFGPPIRGSRLAELGCLPFTTSVQDFADRFQTLACHAPGVTARERAELFVGDLPDHIHVDVEMRNPQDLQTAMYYAHAYEQHANAMQQAFPGSGAPPPARRPPPRRAPPCGHCCSHPHADTYLPALDASRAARAALQEHVLQLRRAIHAGSYVRPPILLGYHRRCGGGGPHRGARRHHTLRGRRHDLRSVDATAFVVSLHAMEEIKTAKTMLLPVTIHRERLTALVDTGSTHNFLSRDAMRRLALQPAGAEKFSVTVANGDRLACQGVARQVPVLIGDEPFSIDCVGIDLGCYDFILGVDFLSTLGPILWDLDVLSLIFWREGGRRVQWTGIGGSGAATPQLQGGRT
ncbi:hypothetical protein QYE76_040322 [Lolium multiflorum]|uniref:TF-B3 domain-containing protein n=1 Tax=Lolium multiflorum TaxID=4521 RepID=A0AAD8WT42_LOLMU|nr:hypothetical protein QYE76_040322 [Lolium multiflorum]